MKRTPPDRHITLKLCPLYESLLAEARGATMALKIRDQTGSVQDRWGPDTVKEEIRLHDNTTGESVCECVWDIKQGGESGSAQVCDHSGTSLGVCWR